MIGEELAGQGAGGGSSDSCPNEAGLTAQALACGRCLDSEVGLVAARCRAAKARVAPVVAVLQRAQLACA